MSTSSFGSLVRKAQESGGSFDLIPADNYISKCIESEYKLSSGGKPQIKTRWEVVQGPHAGYKGIWLYFTLTIDNPNAVAIFFRQIKAMGITQDFLDALSEFDNETAVKQIANALEGRMASLKMKQDLEYNNMKVDRLNPVPPDFVGGGTVAAPSAPFGGEAAAPGAAAPAPPSSPF